jgi:hypothetical protein
VNTKLGDIIQSVPISCHKEGYTLWDSFVVNSAEIDTLDKFVKHFEKTLKINIASVIYGSFMFYSSFFNSEKLESRRHKRIVDIIEGELKVKLGSTITLQICDDSDDDVELPEVLFIL